MCRERLVLSCAYLLTKKSKKEFESEMSMPSLPCLHNVKDYVGHICDILVPDPKALNYSESLIPWQFTFWRRIWPTATHIKRRMQRFYHSRTRVRTAAVAPAAVAAVLALRLDGSGTRSTLSEPLFESVQHLFHELVSTFSMRLTGQ